MADAEIEHVKLLGSGVIQAMTAKDAMAKLATTYPSSDIVQLIVRNFRKV